MDYRDDREALRARVDELEGELAAARTELARIRNDGTARRVRELEEQLDEANRQADALRSEVDALLKLKPSSASFPLTRAVQLTTLGLAGVVLAALLTRRPATPPPPAAPQPKPADTSPPPHVPSMPAPPPEPDDAPEPAPQNIAPSRALDAVWKARVVRSTGDGPPVGTACTATVHVRGGGAKLSASRFELRCGARALYRSTDRLEGMAMMAASVEERATPRGVRFVNLVWEDTGARRGPRTQVSLRSAKKAGSAWSDMTPSFRTEVAIDPESAELEEEPLLEATRNATQEALVVRSATGRAPVRVGTACDLAATPTPPKCPITIQCGGVLLYGGGSVAPCTIEQGRILRAEDATPREQDNDGTLLFDAPARTARVSDGEGPAAWVVELGPR